MKGQLGFDEFMDISEEGQRRENKNSGGITYRTPMVDPCHYCLCNSCINNAENTAIRPDEIPDGWEPCFYCEDCRKFDGDTAKRNMEREGCARYGISNYHAGQRRKKLKVIK